MLSIAMLVYAITPEIEAMTRRNIDYLLAKTVGEFELRVLVNGGPVVSFPHSDRLVPIYMAERSSIAKAYNLAFSGAKGDHFACVHNDVTVPRGWNAAMQAVCEDGIAFPAVEEDEQECRSRGIGTTQKGFPTGCCFLLARETFEALGGFDEVYEGCHFEDTDLWMRAVEAGRRLVRADVAVLHGRGKTRTALEDRANPDFHRNRLIYADKFRREDGSVPIPTLQETPTWPSTRTTESATSSETPTAPSAIPAGT
jgi:hypothetical protein